MIVEKGGGVLKLGEGEGEEEGEGGGRGEEGFALPSSSLEVGEGEISRPTQVCFWCFFCCFFCCFFIVFVC